MQSILLVTSATSLDCHRQWRASFTAYTWIPIVAPLLGGVVGAFIYDYTNW